jgi:hypothetical protein
MAGGLAQPEEIPRVILAALCAVFLESIAGGILVPLGLAGRGTLNFLMTACAAGFWFMYY